VIKTEMKITTFISVTFRETKVVQITVLTKVTQGPQKERGTR
jgi:hypothetical protein